MRVFGQSYASNVFDVHANSKSVSLTTATIGLKMAESSWYDLNRPWESFGMLRT